MGKLLIIADRDDRCVATARGLELAHRLGYSAEVVGFTWAPLKGLGLSSSEKAQTKLKLLGDREREIEERIARFRHDNDRISLMVVWEKDIVHWVLERTRDREYTAVVKTGHRSETLLHTPSDWRLLRECPAPVLIVSSERWHRTKPVMVALDLATNNRRKRKLNHKLVANGLRVARALRADLHLIAAVEVPTVLSELDMVDPVVYVKDQKEAMQVHIQDLAKTHDLPPDAFRVKRGPVAKVITSEAARVRAQLVVIGTVGRKGVEARLLGNTAESVLQLLHTDVLALKP